MKPYATGIYVHYGYAGDGKSGWWARLEWKSGEFAKAGFIEGRIENRYAEPTLDAAITLVLSGSPEKLSLHLSDGNGFVSYDEEVDEKPQSAETAKSIRDACDRLVKLAGDRQ